MFFWNTTYRNRVSNCSVVSLGVLALFDNFTESINRLRDRLVCLMGKVQRLAVLMALA